MENNGNLDPCKPLFSDRGHLLAVPTRALSLLLSPPLSGNERLIHSLWLYFESMVKENTVQDRRRRPILNTSGVCSKKARLSWHENDFFLIPCNWNSFLQKLKVLEVASWEFLELANGLWAVLGLSSPFSFIGLWWYWIRFAFPGKHSWLAEMTLVIKL